MSREATGLELRQLDSGDRLFASIKAFLAAVDVVENELLDPASLPDPLAQILAAYYERLDRYHLLTYGQQVVRAVAELERPELASEIHSSLRHLVVDEYQDFNPAQERLIRLLVGPDTELCVVGDDHQAIYAWRGSDVSNIVAFPKRYGPVATFEIATNRRSRPGIIEVANAFSATITGGKDRCRRGSLEGPRSRRSPGESGRDGQGSIAIRTGHRRGPWAPGRGPRRLARQGPECSARVPG